MTHRWSYFPVVLNDNEEDGEDEEDSYGENYRLPLFREDHVLRQGGYGEVTKEIIPPNHIILGHLSDDIGIPKAPYPVSFIVRDLIRPVAYRFLFRAGQTHRCPKALLPQGKF